MRVAVVNLQRQVMLLRNANMLAETVVLRFLTLFAGAEIVQAGLANSAHTVGGGELVEGGERRLQLTGCSQLRGGVGVNRNGGEDTLISLRGSDRVQGGRDIASDLHDSADTQLFTGIERIAGGDFYFAVEQVHVGMVIHDGVRQRLGGGREDQVAAAAVLAGGGAAAGSFSAFGVADAGVEFRLIGCGYFTGHRRPAIRQGGCPKCRGGGQGVVRQGGEGVQVLLGDFRTGMALTH